MPYHRVVGVSVGLTEGVGIEGASGLGPGFISNLLDGARIFDGLEENGLHTLVSDDADDFFHMLGGGILRRAGSFHRIDGEAVVTGEVSKCIVLGDELSAVVGK